MEPIDIAVIVAYVLVLIVLSAYGSHRYWMAFLYYRHKYRLPTPLARLEILPRVTVQLPVFNEMYVVKRLVDAVARLDYPRDRLQIQVLDDSTDETCEIARACVDRWREVGLDVASTGRASRPARSRTGSGPPPASWWPSSTPTSSPRPTSCAAPCTSSATRAWAWCRCAGST
jgi:cellulose synthase/poly-beta-1,6-N-acetylglucosamine synthase-like glycosyltransferase